MTNAYFLKNRTYSSLFYDRQIRAPTYKNGNKREDCGRVCLERFHRIDAVRSRARGGTGLGLSIVRAIAEAHGGLVRAVDPRNGGGAQLELVLPGFRPA